MFGFGAIGQFAIGQVESAAETITFNIFGYEFSSPIREKINKQLAIALMVSGAVISPFALTQPENVTEDRWHNSWSEPVRIKPRLLEGSQPFAVFLDPLPFVSFGWDAWLSEPVKVKQRLHESLQQFTTYTNATSATDSIESRWHYQWSEPVRFKPELKPGLQQAISFYPAPSPFVSSGWYNWLTEPVREKPGLKPSLQQFLIHYPEIPSPVFLLEGWFNWLSEPVRFPSGLKVWLQQTTAMPPRLLPPINITGTLNTTEFGDLFLAGGQLWGRINSALVGIIDIVPKAASAGVIEIQPISANVGQVVTPVAQQSGMAVSQVSSANVSIRVV